MYSFLFMTATWVTGQTAVPPAPGYAPQAASVQVMVEAPAPAGVLGRVRGLLQRRPEAMTPVAYPQAMPPYPQPMPSGPPMVMTSPYASVPRAPAAVPAPAPVAEVVTAERPNLEGVRLAGEVRMGHEPDYSSITGYLYYVRADGGRWVLRYARLDQEDRYGGSVVLVPAVEMKIFREGDLVCVHGEILDSGRVSRSLGGAPYRVNAITMIERGDPE